MFHCHAISIWLGLLIYMPHAYMKSLCNNSDQCHCVGSPSSYEIKCPRNFDRTEQGFVIQLEQRLNPSEWKLRIDCYNVTDSSEYEKISPDVFTGKVTMLRMQSCPFPNEISKQILRKFNISNLQHMWHELYNLSSLTLIQDYFNDIGSLNVLTLNSDELVNINPTVFQKLSNLESLNLYDNYVHLISDTFKFLPKLRRLVLSKNRLDILPDETFRFLSKLEILELYSNNISTLHEKTFIGLISLLSLELSLNKITYIHENAFRDLVSLVNISLSSNALNFLPAKLFSNNQNLKLIRLRYSAVTNLTNGLFSGLHNLEEIDFTHSHLNLLPTDVFEGSTNIYKINLSYNNLEQIPDNLFDDLGKLKILNLQNNKLSTISNNPFGKMYNLQKLYLQKNQLREISASSFSNLINLIELDLSSNFISKMTGMFENNPNLKVLSLAHNEYYLEHVRGSTPFNKLLNLEKLDLSHNVIEEINIQEFLLSKPQLREINLSYNIIPEIEISQYIPILQPYNLTVDLSYNNISRVTFSPSINWTLMEFEIDVQHLTTFFTKLNLSSNPVICDCGALDLAKYFKGTLYPQIREFVQISSKNLVCAEPEAVRYVNIVDLGLGMFMCPTESQCSQLGKCSWRPIDRAVIADFRNKNLTLLPQISLSEKYDKLLLMLENNSIKALSPVYEGYNVTELLLSNNSIQNVTWVPPSIEILQLDHNHIARLDYQILHNLSTNTRLKRITLDSNPWICDCLANNFSKFLRNNFKKINSSNVYCVQSNIALESLNENQLCTSNSESILISCSIIFATLFIAVGIAAVYYRFNREIKIWLFAKNICLWLVTEEELDEDKIYDAFISYSHKDEKLVEDLVEILENGPQPYKLCLHYRDFIPGKFIATQVHDSVRDSRRTIIILSHNFLESVWAKLEFQTAHLQAMKERRPKLIIILYGEVNLDSLDEELKIYLKTNTYVKWGDPWFWNKLRYALPHANKRIEGSIQKHTNMMMSIDNKFAVVQQLQSDDLKSPHQILMLDANSLKNKPSYKMNEDLKENS